VLDKVYSSFLIENEDIGMPKRKLDWDGLRCGIVDESDPVTAAYPGLPDTLDLWHMATRSGSFFDPDVRGFQYVEVYNPEYWTEDKGVFAQFCFHPMYRMIARSTLSAVHLQTIAFWTTKYANVKPNVPGTIAAKSAHLGFPLFYFDRNDARAFIDVIFDEWGISAAGSP
jgi:hypothetical protein